MRVYEKTVLEVLDIGCGIDPKGNVNCDVSNVFLSHGCFPKNFVVATALALPFRSNSFLKAYLTEVLEHFDDDDVITVLQETKRVAKKATISVPNAFFAAGSWKFGWTSIGTTDRKILREYPHIQIFDEVMFEDALRLVYTKVKIRGTMGTWIAIPGLIKLFEIISKRIPFLARFLEAYCE